MLEPHCDGLPNPDGIQVGVSLERFIERACPAALLSQSERGGTKSTSILTLPNKFLHTCCLRLCDVVGLALVIKVGIDNEFHFTY